MFDQFEELTPIHGGPRRRDVADFELRDAIQRLSGLHSTRSEHLYTDRGDDADDEQTVEDWTGVIEAIGYPTGQRAA
jgi:hypothetical protein